MKNLSRLDQSPRPRHAAVDGHGSSRRGSRRSPVDTRRQASAWLAPLLEADRRHLAAAALGIIGLAISIYLAATKLAPQDVTLYCSVSAPLDCQKVTSSPESMLFGIPVPGLGAAGFVAWRGLAALAIWLPFPRLATVRLIWTLGGVGFVAYLVYSELFVIGSICEWCTTTHVIVLALFGLSLWEVVERRSHKRVPRTVRP